MWSKTGCSLSEAANVVIAVVVDSFWLCVVLNRDMTYLSWHDSYKKNWKINKKLHAE